MPVLRDEQLIGHLFDPALTKGYQGCFQVGDEQHSLIHGIFISLFQILRVIHVYAPLLDPADYKLVFRLFDESGGFNLGSLVERLVPHQYIPELGNKIRGFLYLPHILPLDA